MNVYQRNVSSVERMWLVAGQLVPPYANQVILEGTGRLDPDRWRTAVQKASQANPGMRVVLRGGSLQMKWVDGGQTPPVRVVDGSRWSGADFENGPFLKEPLPAEAGPTCEVLLIEGDPLRVAFRTLHAVADGRGTLWWMADIFRALRDEPVIGSDSTINDEQLARTIYNPLPKKEPRLAGAYLSPTGERVGAGAGFDFRRIRIQGRFSKLLPQVAWIISREAWKHGAGPVRVMVPVDIRSHMPGIRSTGNLSVALYLDSTPDTTVQDISTDLKRQLEAAQECYQLARPSQVRLDALVHLLPLGLFRAGFAARTKRSQQTGKYTATAMLSNLGRVSLAEFQGGGFTGQAIFCIPPGHPYFPLFLSFFGYGDTLDIGATVPVALANGGRLDGLLDVLRRDLVPEPAPA